MTRALGLFTSLVLCGCAGAGASARTTSTLAGGAAPVSAEGAAASPADSARLVAELEVSRDAFLSSVKGLSEAQLRFRAAPDRWSIAEVAEHIAVAEEGILATISGKVMASALTPDLAARRLADDARVKEVLADRGHKRTAPERLRPTGRFASLDATVAAFSTGRARTIDYARSTPLGQPGSEGQGGLRGHALEHPALGVIDGYQWLLFLSAHSARHTAQIEEVKAAPGFPR